MKSAPIIHSPPYWLRLIIRFYFWFFRYEPDNYSLISSSGMKQFDFKLQDLEYKNGTLPPHENKNYVLDLSFRKMVAELRQVKNQNLSPLITPEVEEIINKFLTIFPDLYSKSLLFQNLSIDIYPHTIGINSDDKWLTARYFISKQLKEIGIHSEHVATCLALKPKNIENAFKLVLSESDEIVIEPKNSVGPYR